MDFKETILFQDYGYAGVIITGIVIILLTAIVSKVLVSALRRIINRTTDGEVGGSIIENIIKVTVWLVGIAILLRACFNFDVSVLLGALGIGGIALSLGLQNTVSNLIGGFQTSLSRDIVIGDWVTVSNMTGKIIDINWRVTKVSDTLGCEHIIPNSVFNTTAVTVLPEWQRVPINLVLARGADTDIIAPTVEDLAFNALKEAGMTVDDKRPLFAINGTAVDSVDAVLTLFAHRDYTFSQVNAVASPPVIEYLRSIEALAICGL